MLFTSRNWTCLTSLSLYIFTIWKCIAYNFFCRDGIYFDKILVSNINFLRDRIRRASSASFLDLYLEFDDSGQLSTKIYDKQDDFNFKIINFPNMCSNIPASPAYGVYFSQLWGTPAYWSLVPRSSMFYLNEFCLKNMWNCSLTQQILCHSFYD
jgi:hypothetical protein